MSMQEILSQLRNAAENREFMGGALLEMEEDMPDISDNLASEYFNCIEWLESHGQRLLNSSDKSHEIEKKQLKNELAFANHFKQTYLDVLRTGAMSYGDFKTELRMLNAALRDGGLEDMAGGAKQKPKPSTKEPSSHGAKPKSYLPEPVEEVDDELAEQLRQIAEMEEREAKQAHSKPDSAKNRRNEEMERAARERERLDAELREDQARREKQKKKEEKRRREEQEKQKKKEQEERRKEEERRKRMQQEDDDSFGEYEDIFVPPSKTRKEQGHPNQPVSQAHEDEEFEGEEVIRGLLEREQPGSDSNRLTRMLESNLHNNALTNNVTNHVQNTKDEERRADLFRHLNKTQSSIDAIRAAIQQEEINEVTLSDKLKGLQGLALEVKLEIETIKEQNMAQKTKNSQIKDEVAVLKVDLKDIEDQIEEAEKNTDQRLETQKELRKLRQAHKEKLMMIEIDINKYKTGYNSLMKRWKDELNGNVPDEDLGSLRRKGSESSWEPSRTRSYFGRDFMNQSDASHGSITRFSNNYGRGHSIDGFQQPLQSLSQGGVESFGGSKYASKYLSRDFSQRQEEPRAPLLVLPS